MKKSAILLLLLFAALAAGAQPFYRKPVAPVRNVIVMIPDGTSTSVLAATRWYKFYNDPSQRTLNLDSCLLFHISPGIPVYKIKLSTLSNRRLQD